MSTLMKPLYYYFLSVCSVSLLIICGSLLTVPSNVTAETTSSHVTNQTSNTTSSVPSNDSPELIPVVKKLEKRLLKEFERLDIKFQFDIIDLEILSGLQFLSDYKFSVEPSFKGNQMLRSDLWRFHLVVDPADWLSLPSGLGTPVTRGLDVLFVRTKNSIAEAVAEFPYSPLRIPFNHKIIQERMEVGELVALTSHLNLLVGANKGWNSSQFVSSVATHYLIRGEFQIHILKKSDQWVRLRLFLIHRNSKALMARLGLPPEDLNVTGIKMVDNKIEKIFDATNLFLLNHQKSKAQILLFDYMVNIAHPRGAQAYDQVMDQFFAIRSGTVINPTLRKSKREDLLITNLTPLEDLFEEQKNQENPVVERLFKGQNQIPFDVNSRFKFGILLLHISEDRRYSENFLSYYDKKEQKNIFQINSFEKIRNFNALFSLFKESNISRASLILEADENRKILNIQDLFFEWDYRDKKLTKSEYRLIKEGIRQNSTEHIFSQIPWHLWEENRVDEQVNARLLMNSVLNPEALKYLSLFDKASIKKHFIEYLRTIPEPTAASANPFSSIEGHDGRFGSDSIIEKYQYDIEWISEKLAFVFNPVDEKTLRVRPNEERARAFSELRFNDLFIEVGVGFLLSLLPRELLPQLFYFEMSLVANKMPPIYFKWGTPPKREAYQLVSYIFASLNGRPIDLLLRQD
ncbi:MAG: hypothetical protein RMK80_03705 [Pseudobdellovibrionaceae bacterium]|nr:hypothetical protein [Pseudobdellovibrionaceae bacterium]